VRFGGGFGGGGFGPGLTGSGVRGGGFGFAACPSPATFVGSVGFTLPVRKAMKDAFFGRRPFLMRY